MSKKSGVRKKTTKYKGDPVVNELAVINARGMMLSNILGIGWRLALIVLVPIFVAVQLDKKFDTKPSLTLAAFFIAIFGAGVMIAKTFNELSRRQMLDDAKEEKRKKRRLLKRRKNV